VLWNNQETYTHLRYENEAEIETAVNTVKLQLVGSNSSKGKINNLLVGYLLDLTNQRDPRKFIVENDISNYLLQFLLF
jgi:hypothetical protein